MKFDKEVKTLMWAKFFSCLMCVFIEKSCRLKAWNTVKVGKYETFNKL